jgi:L-amino acid N-acyltransferase YncA
MKESLDVEIRPMIAHDWSAVKRIYLQGIATGNATFETSAPSWEQWDQRHRPFARLIATCSGNGVDAGWAAISPVSSRHVYRGVAEVSVYVGSEHWGRGIGQELLKHLVAAAEKNGIWTLQASIFPENVASIRLHKACGFREVGIRKRIGKRDDQWRDTILLERRSRVAGCD